MTDTLVTDCEGFLLDSELGDVPGTYDHNENYTFTICPDEADAVSLSFSEFCTEFLFDSLRIYDGPDTLSTLIGGPYLGEDDPPNLIAYSGCITVNFISDPSVTCTGWTAFWTTDFIIPEPPIIQPITDLPCESNQLLVEFDSNIHCDSLYAGAFSISGPQFPNVISTVPSCVGDSAMSVTLTFAPPIDFAGNYNVFFTQNISECENTYVLQSIGSFAVVNCPLNVLLELESEVACTGDSTLLTTLTSGGDMNYTYTWSPIFSDSSFAEIIVFGPTIYYVTVTDGLGATATDSIFLTPEPLPTFGIPDTTLCQSDTAFYLIAFPIGGEWFGGGIVEEDTGLYDPGMAEYARDTIIYVTPNGCENELFIDFTPLDEGTDDAACIGADTFFVSGGLPIGGIWTGENITMDGIFTPTDTAASFAVTYTHPNGCAGTKFVNIDTITLPQIDSLCQSEQPFLIPTTPFGGIWSGTGIVDEDTGEFNPNEAELGDNILTYNIEGCVDSMVIHVKEIEAGDNFSACPEQAPFALPDDWYPFGGIWAGQGIIDPLTGMYDPSLVADIRDTLTFTINGCTDRRIAFVLQTTIDVEADTLYFCPEDEAVNLPLERPDVLPQFGIWYGTGVQQIGEEEFIFDPTVAGTGTHQLYYEKNTCTDSIPVVIYPTPEIPTAIYCEVAGAVQLEVSPLGGEWSGTGIINPLTGVFDPTTAGDGTFIITNTSNDGCVGMGQITVEPFNEASIDNGENFYCSTSQIVDLGLSPAGGVLEIDGEVYPNFIPALFEEGDYVLIYTVGEGECADTETFNTSVGAPIVLQVPFTEDSLCFGQGTTLTATASGDNSLGNFTYTWNQNLGFGQNHLVQPTTDTEYTVTASDGCSDNATATINIAVAAPIFVEFETQDPVCFDETTSAEVFATPGNNYTFLWSTIPVTESNFIESHPTSFTVTVTDNDSGCSTTEFIDLPGYDLIQANFGISPNVECLTTIDPTIQILDFSIGATSGFWLLGDSTNVETYREGENLEYTFPDTGNYVVTLHLENEGGCISEHQLPVCVKAEHRLFAPNAMTPNGDGKNDEFGFKGTNVETIEWYVYNRFGEMIYQGNAMNDRWNGKFKGTRVQNGVYTWYAVYTARGVAGRLEKKGFVTVIK
ncbi:MAG: gliding motility-associated-like protein [Saprospiraceae bacterium]|jgi:gliding motility-associated-like protein